MGGVGALFQTNKTKLTAKWHKTFVVNPVCSIKLWVVRDVQRRMLHPYVVFHLVHGDVDRAHVPNVSDVTRAVVAHTDCSHSPAFVPAGNATNACTGCGGGEGASQHAVRFQNLDTRVCNSLSCVERTPPHPTPPLSSHRTRVVYSHGVGGRRSRRPCKARQGNLDSKESWLTYADSNASHDACRDATPPAPDQVPGKCNSITSAYAEASSRSAAAPSCSKDFAMAASALGPLKQRRHQYSARQHKQKASRLPPRENNDGVPHQCSRADSRLLRDF